MSTPIQSSLDFQGISRALNLLDPTNPQDAATKIYVDNSVTNINNGMIVVNEFTALTTSGTNWAPNDILIRFQVTTNAGAITSTIWYTSNGTTLATPPVVGTDVEDTQKTLQGTTNNKLSSIDNKTPTLGQALAVGSSPVVLTAAQLTTLTPLSKVAIDQTGNIVAATTLQNAAVALGNGVNLNVQGYVLAIISITGAMGANTAIAFEVSVDDVTFVPLAGHQIGLAGNLVTTTTNTGDFRFNTAGYKSLRARISVFGTGSITAKGYVSTLPSHATTVNSNIIAALPSGSNTIGNVNQTLATAEFAKLTDGTNTVGVLTSAPASDTGQSALAVRVISQLAAGGALDPSLTSSGTITSINGAVSLTLNGQYANTVFQISGTWTGTLIFEASNDNFATQITSINALRAGDNTISQTIVDSAPSNDLYRVTVAGFGNVRVRAGTAITGSVVVIAIASTKTSGVFLNFPIPAGANTIGAVNINGTVPVSAATDADTISSGTLTAAAQTTVLLMSGKSAASVQISGTWAGTITFEGSVDGTIFNPINAVAASTSQPQPTTTVNGLYRLSPAGLVQIRAIMTAFTSGSASISMRASAGTGGIFANQILPSKITDGTNTVTIKPASTAPTITDQAAVVALSPNGNQATAANQLTLNNKLQNGSQDSASALSVTMTRKTTVVGFITTTTAANLNLLDPSGAGAYTDVRDFNSCCIILTVPAGTVSYTVQGSLAATASANYNIDAYTPAGLRFATTQTSTTAGFIKIYVPLVDVNFIRVFLDTGAAIGAKAELLATSDSFQLPRGAANVLSLPNVNAAAPLVLLDINTALTASVDSTAVTILSGTSTKFEVYISAVTGTLPVMVVTVQDSLDGVAWNDLYIFTPISFTGMYRSPLLPNARTQIRYSFAITAGASFSTQVYRSHTNNVGASIQFPRRNNGFNVANTAVDILLGGRTNKITIANSTAVVYFLQFHTSSAPAGTAVTAGAVASEVIHIPANATLRLNAADFTEAGSQLYNGSGLFCRMAISTAFATYTAISIAARGLYYNVESV